MSKKTKRFLNKVKNAFLYSCLLLAGFCWVISCFGFDSASNDVFMKSVVMYIVSSAYIFVFFYANTED